MPMKNLLRKTVLVSLLIATTVMAQTPYDEGQKALREQDWLEAAGYFEQAIKTDADRADASMYWRAYAFSKAGRVKEAERELRRLERKYPDSNWVKEAQALRIEQQGAGSTVAGDLIDEDLRLYALMQLMDRNPERALPLVLDLAQNAESESVRQDAVFILAVNDHPAAQQALAEIARDGSNPKMQRYAIQALGTMEATAELEAIYPALTDKETRITLIEAFAIADAGAALKKILAEEKDPELRQAALSAIAMTDEGDSGEYLLDVYRNATSREEKMAILEALIITDNAEELAYEVLKFETDAELQQEAIMVLGIEEATGKLEELYSSLKSRDSKMAVIEAMAIADDTGGLFRILQTEQDPELRSTAIQGLAISGGDEAAAYLLKLYPESRSGDKSAIIESMMIMDDTEGLIGLLKRETDPELKRQMMQMLSIMDSDASEDYLFELLEEKG